jgi:hypothetical protein
MAAMMVIVMVMTAAATWFVASTSKA